MATNKLPRDLFAPLGGSGQITIDFTAKTAEPLGTLSSAKRTVTTRIGNSERVSTEVWSLTQL